MKNAAPDDDAMRSSANALTKRLYATVMDVFGNYVANDEDDYNNMLKTLRNKQVQRQETRRSHAESEGTRALIATKLLEGHAFNGDVCGKCVMPLMVYEGRVSCVVCKEVDHGPAMAPSLSDAPLALASTTESEMEEIERECEVNKELSLFNERRSQATHVYTAKILDGYAMQDELCTKCDMPMMCYKDSVDCVFCPKTPKPTKRVEIKTKDIAAAAANLAATAKPQVLKQVKALSQAEVVAARLRGMQSKGYGADIESELEKAEGELLKMLASLGGGPGNQSAGLEEYFSQKKADRASTKWLKEAENGILEAEVLAASEELNCSKEDSTDSEPVVATPVNEKANFGVSENENGVFFETGPVQHMAVATPKVESSISCSIGDALIPSLKTFFPTASCPIDVEEVHARAYAAPPSTTRLEARKRIAMLVAEGWEVSEYSCPHCELPMFSNGQTVNGFMRCVVCGPVTGIGHNINAQGDLHCGQELDKGGEEDVTTKMVNRIMDGWIIIEGQQCPDCYMPAMFDPQTHLKHCVTCGVLEEYGASEQGKLGPADVNGNEVISSLEACANNDPSPRTDVRGAKDPGSETYVPVQTQMRAKENKLKVEIAPEPIYLGQPDPTTSMHEFRGKLLDPPPSMQVLHNNVDGVAENELVVQHVMGEPTPAMKELWYKLNEPTPNMQAARNKAYNSVSEETAHRRACDPTPSMHIARGKLVDSEALHDISQYNHVTQFMVGYDPTSATRDFQYNQSAPTPNMQSVQAMSGHAPAMHAQRGRFNSLAVSTPTYTQITKQVDPTPSNFTTSSKMDH